MPLVYVPRAGVTGLISTLERLGLVLADITVGAPSVGSAGQVNASDGAGGWIATDLFRVNATLFESHYQNFTFSPDNPGGVLDCTDNVAQIIWDVATTYRVEVAGITALNMLAATGTTRASNRLLVSGGGISSDNWVDPQTANNLIVSSAVNIAPSASQTTRELTVLLTAGGLTVTLPNPAGFGPRKITVKDRNGFATATPDVVNVSGGSTIDGAAAVNLNANYQALNFQCDGTNWFQV